MLDWHSIHEQTTWSVMKHCNSTAEVPPNYLAPVSEDQLDFSFHVKKNCVNADIKAYSSLILLGIQKEDNRIYIRRC